MKLFSTSPWILSESFPWALGGVAAFHLAYGVSTLCLLIIGYLVCLMQLIRRRTMRQAFYLGLAVGLLTVAPQMSCLWTIFGPSAIALWLVLAFWIGLFGALARLCLIRFGQTWGVLLVPFVWTGLEYFRSELYYLRFSWLNVGYAFSNSSALPIFHWFGIYGLGFLAASVAAVSLLPPKGAALFSLAVALLAVPVPLLQSSSLLGTSRPSADRSVRVAGVQMEFPSDAEVVSSLNHLLRIEPQAELLVLSEYTFDGTVPDKIAAWCRDHQRYLVVGGKDPAPKSNFYDTAFVIGPTGEIIFRQVKSVPIQFFKDGLPAREQRLWDSPWGKIGLCICYDLSYARVTDRLVRLGAQAMIVPTMDVVDWGRREHELHARVAPIRSAEYGIPIFRVASSGISQWTDRSGRIMAAAPFPGQQKIIGGRLTLASAGSLPWDRWLAPFATGVTGSVILWSLCRRRFRTSDSLKPTNKLTGANARGPCQLPMRTRWAARVAQFRR